MSINRLIPNPPGEIVDGEIIYKGEDLLKLSYDDIIEPCFKGENSNE